MATEDTIYGQDMMDYLRPEELEAFLVAKKEVDEYRKKLQVESPPPGYSTPSFDEHNRFINLVRERKGMKAKLLAALKEINPPYEDARRYLNDQEHKEFLNSLRGAADAFLSGGKGCPFGDWQLHEKAISFSGFVLDIKKRRGEEARQERAQLESDQFIKEINDAEKGLKQQLAREKKPKFAYPTWLAGYHPDLWCELLLPTKQKIEDWARPQIRERIPLALREFVRWDISWEVQAEPYAKYVGLGIPCLVWCFKIFILVEVHLRLAERKFSKSFQGYQFETEIEAGGLGTFFVGPIFWANREGFAIPLALLSAMGKGKLEGDGIEVVERGPPFTKFAVRGFRGEVQIHEAFRRFIQDTAKEQSLSMGLRAKGLIDDAIASLIEAKINLPLPQPASTQVSPGEKASNNNDALIALQSLGYKKAESQQMVQAADLPLDMSLEKKLQTILKALGS